MVRPRVREANPLQQGLKPLNVIVPIGMLSSSGGKSITTRIETCVDVDQTKYNRRVREANPLQQGLKQAIVVSSGLEAGQVREANPLQQGLKRYPCEFGAFLLLKVREANPLQQGLKDAGNGDRIEADSRF